MLVTLSWMLLLPILSGCRLKCYVDAVGVVQQRFADARPVVVERFIIDVVVSAGLVGFNTSTEAELIGPPPLLTSVPRQLGRHRRRRVENRVGFQSNGYSFHQLIQIK